MTAPDNSPTEPLAACTEKEPGLPVSLAMLNACIHCGMCLPACPTYELTGSEAESPRGRIYLMRKQFDQELAHPDQLKKHLDGCLACLACETACPSGVQYGSLLTATREALAKTDRSIGRRVRRWAYEKVLPDHPLLLKLTGFLRFYQNSGLQLLLRSTRLLKLIPPLAHLESLLPKLKSYRTLREGMSFGPTLGEHVVLFPGCVMDTMYNHVHWDTVSVLETNGFHVSIAPATCCGALAHHEGETDITRSLAKSIVENLSKLNPDWVVLNSAGCGSSMQHYGELLADHPVLAKRAKEFAARVIDITTLLDRRREAGKLAPFKRPVQRTITYHAACHLHHAQKQQHTTENLLKVIPGLTLVPLRDAAHCCGSAGVYNVENPADSTAILSDKIENLRATLETAKTDTVVTGNPGCMLQIEKGLRDAGITLKVQHPVEILAEAYR